MLRNGRYTFKTVNWIIIGNIVGDTDHVVDQIPVYNVNKQCNRRKLDQKKKCRERNRL